MKHDCFNCKFDEKGVCTYRGQISTGPINAETANDDECAMWELKELKPGQIRLESTRGV